MLTAFLQDYQDISERMRQGLEIRTRKWLLKSYPDVFVGKDAVTWLVENKFAKNRDDAVAIGNRLVQKRVSVAV